MFKKVLTILRNQQLYRFLFGIMIMEATSPISAMDDVVSTTQLDGYLLTPEKFKSLADQILILEDYNLSPHQAKLIFGPEQYTSSYSITETDFYRTLADIYLIDLPKTPKFDNSYLLDFTQENTAAPKIRGTIKACTSDYNFSITLTVFNDPEINIKGVTNRQGTTLFANLITETSYLDKKAPFMDRLKKVAGKIQCKWSKNDGKSLLSVDKLTVEPYSFDEVGNILIPALDRAAQPLRYTGLVELDYKNRLNKLEIFLERFAFEIAKVDTIQIMKNGVDSKAIEILSTDNGNGIFFKKADNCLSEKQVYYLNAPVVEEEEHIRLNVSLEDESAYSSKSSAETEGMDF